jgi:hypothetical protein
MKNPHPFSMKCLAAQSFSDLVQPFVPRWEELKATGPQKNLTIFSGTYYCASHSLRVGWKKTRAMVNVHLVENMNGF